MRSIVLSAALAVAGFSSGAHAGCIVAGGVHFFVDQNDTVTLHLSVSKGGCVTFYRAGGQVAFTGASIVQKPVVGMLKQTGPLQFHYVPKPGYIGPDKYTIKVCGHSTAGSGCSTLNYEASVN